MGEIYRLGCQHRQAHAERGGLYSKLTNSLGGYDRPLYRSPRGYAVFSHDEDEAAFQHAYLAEYGFSTWIRARRKKPPKAPEPESFTRMERDNAFISVPDVGNMCGVAAAEPMLRATLTVMTGRVVHDHREPAGRKCRVVDLGAAEPMLEVFQLNAPVGVDADEVEPAPVDRFQWHRGIGNGPVEDLARPFGGLSEEDVERGRCARRP
jgi:hypothetical protein